MNKAVADKIKSIIHTFIPEAKVVLFGSYARGEQTQNSDYDLLVITKESYSPREKINWRTKIHNNLVTSLHAPFDVLMDSEEEVNRKKELLGHIVRYALKEGIFL